MIFSTVSWSSCRSSAGRLPSTITDLVGAGIAGRARSQYRETLRRGIYTAYRRRKGLRPAAEPVRSAVEREKIQDSRPGQEHFPRLRLKALAHCLGRHRICCAGVQREGWSILRVLSWQTGGPSSPTLARWNLWQGIRSDGWPHPLWCGGRYGDVVLCLRGPQPMVRAGLRWRVCWPVRLRLPPGRVAVRLGAI